MCSDSLAESYSESASIFAIAPFLRWYLFSKSESLHRIVLSSIASYCIIIDRIVLYHHRSHRIASHHHRSHCTIIVRIVSSIAPSHHHRSYRIVIIAPSIVRIVIIDRFVAVAPSSSTVGSYQRRHQALSIASSHHRNNRIVTTAPSSFDRIVIIDRIAPSSFDRIIITAPSSIVSSFHHRIVSSHHRRSIAPSSNPNLMVDFAKA